MKVQRTKGFTLIELLIVVAIIAILAAIAIPNFLEAQVRAKVSRSKNDLRSLGLAHEAYRVDWNDWCIGPQDNPRPIWTDYIPQEPNKNWRNIDGANVEFGQWFHLTTPVAYITSLPRDAFKKEFNQQWIIWRDYYRMWNLTQKPGPSTGWGTPSTYYAKCHGVQVLMAGVGPDGIEDVSDGTQSGWAPGQGSQSGLCLYDPTNGSLSWGDIYYGLPGFGLELMAAIQPVP